MAWKLITQMGNFNETWNYKELGEGAEVEGIYGGSKEITTGEGYEYNVHTVGNKDVFGNAVLDRWLGEVEKGSKIKLVYLGQKNNKKGKPFHNFDVYIDDVDAAKRESFLDS